MNFDHRKIVPATSKRLASAHERFACSCCLDSLIGLQVLEQVWMYKQLGTEREEIDKKDITRRGKQGTEATKHER